MKWHLMEQYVKLILNGFVLHNGDIYITEAFLNYLGMDNSVSSLVSQSKKAKNGRWILMVCNGKRSIRLNSIPEFTRKRLNINFPDEYLKDLLVTHGKTEDHNVLKEIQSEAYLIMQKEINNYRKYLPTFYEVFQTNEERTEHAISYAILRVVVSFVKKYPKGMIEYFFEILKDQKLVKHSIPIESLNYFYKYISRVIKIGLPHALINGNRGKPSNNLKLSPIMKELIIYLKSYGNFTSCREIADNIKSLRYNETIGEEIKEISESTIRNYLATAEADNLTLLARQGYRRFEEKVLGYLPLNRTKNPLTKILIDGYVIQVLAEGEDSKPVKLVLFTIMDTFSGFVVMEIGDREDYDLIGRAFQKFLKFTGFRFPKEIISDGHSSIQSNYFADFRKFLKDNGVTWVISPNPRRKAQLERWFGTLQQIYLSRIVGYIGEGIKSKRKDAHPSEEVQFLLRKKEFLKDKNELKRLILAAGDDYNRNSHFKNAASPLDLYRLKKPINYIQLQEYHLARFFWDRHEVTIRGSMVIVRKTINEKSRKWFYRNTEYDFAKLNGAEIDAYHNPFEDKSIYLFKRGSMTFIKCLTIQLAANEAIHDQSDADKKIIADFGISSSMLHQAYIERLDEIEDNLKSRFGIDAEQLRSHANFKKDADDYIGYEVGIAEKKPQTNPRVS